MEHSIAVAPKKRLSYRAIGLVCAGLLQAGFVWALVVGLNVKDLVKPFVPGIETTFVKDKPKPQPLPPAVATVDLPPVVVPKPIFDVAPENRGGDAITPTGNRPTAAQPSGPADHGPIGLISTHTIPPYPALDIRLGNEGTVLLRLTVAADGRVVDAQLLRTSGSDSLDKAARAWVMAHWRYQPAIRGGAAAAAAVDVAVKFSLKNAG